MGTTGEKPSTRRTRPTNIVLGPAVLTMLDELCAEAGCTRSEQVRTLIVAAHEKTRVTGTRVKGGGPSKHKTR